MQFRKIHLEEVDLVYPLMVQLRTHLDRNQFLESWSLAREFNNYQLMAGFHENHLVGLMGYRILFDFVHGKHIYVDDLIVDESKRSSGFGKAFLEEAQRVAKAEGCRRLRLCTGKDNAGGMRFYERHGWEQRAVVYKFKLEI